MATTQALLFSIGRALATAALDQAFPRGCAACDAELRRRAVFCASCAATVEPAPRPRPQSRRASHSNGVALSAGAHPVPAAAKYGGAVAAAIHRLKYGGRVDVAAPLGELLRRAALGLEFDLVAPVPLHPVRLAERGYNQAALLCRPLARDGARFAPRALSRRRNTPQQTHLARAERLRNVEGAFVASPCVRGQRVLLVDDVVTTGATLDACAQALLGEGALLVLRLALAESQAGSEG